MQLVGNVKIVCMCVYDWVGKGLLCMIWNWTKAWNSKIL